MTITLASFVDLQGFAQTLTALAQIAVEAKPYHLAFVTFYQGHLEARNPHYAIRLDVNTYGAPHEDVCISIPAAKGLAKAVPHALRRAPLRLEQNRPGTLEVVSKCGTFRHGLACKSAQYWPSLTRIIPDPSDDATPIKSFNPVYATRLLQAMTRIQGCKGRTPIHMRTGATALSPIVFRSELGYGGRWPAVTGILMPVRPKATL